jgi:hypothetical protein
MSPLSADKLDEISRIIGNIEAEVRGLSASVDRHLRHLLQCYADYYNPASQHPSVYVVEGNRLCCSG